MTALSLKKQPGLHVSTLVFFGIAFILTAAILIFTFSSAWGAYIGTIEATASSDVFKTFDSFAAHTPSITERFRRG